MPKSPGNRGKVRRRDEGNPMDKYGEEEVQVVNILNLEKELEFRLTTDERWALDVMFGPPNRPMSDEDKRKARRIVKALTRELSQCNFGKRLVFASMQDEIPLEKQAALLPYALPKAPTELEVTHRKEDMSDEQIDARIRELIGDARSVVDV